MSEENNSDEIPVEVISDEKIETNNSEEESKHTDNLEQISDDPIKLLELEKQKVSQYEEKLKPLPHQVGLVFYLNNNCAGMDLFDSPQTYQKFSKKIIRSIAIDAIETHLDSRRVSMHKQIAPSIIRQFLDLLSNLKEEVISAPCIGEEIVMNYPELSIYASATSNDNQIIHLTGYHQIDLQASAQTVH